MADIFAQHTTVPVASGVTGPGSSTDKDLAYWSGAGGDTLADAAGLQIDGSGNLVIVGSKLTAATMTASLNGIETSVLSKFSWTNAMVVNLGANLSGNIKICTLPAKTVVKNCYVVISTQAAGTAGLTVSVGRTGTDYIDYIVASDAQATANTFYGAATIERGTNLTGYDLPSVTGTTDVYAQFISTTDTLDNVTTCTGVVYLETIKLP